jgi:hypothetical protein
MVPNQCQISECIHTTNFLPIKFLLLGNKRILKGQKGVFSARGRFTVVLPFDYPSNGKMKTAKPFRILNALFLGKPAAVSDEDTRFDDDSDLDPDEWQDQALYDDMLCGVAATSTCSSPSRYPDSDIDDYCGGAGDQCEYGDY